MSVEVEKPAEAHIQYIRDAYDRLNEHTLVKKAKSGYGKTKHSFGLLEKTLDYIEGTAYNATNKIAIPAYESYGYLVTNSLLNLYTRGANLLLDTAIFTKSVSGSAINSALDLEKTVEQRIYLFLERSRKYAQVPADKIAEHGNFFLDIANAVFDRFIGLPAEHEDSNNTIGQRVSRLTKRVISGLSARVHNDVTDSASQKIRYFAGQLNQKLALADLVRQRRDWAFEKYSLVTCSVSDLRDKVANQASQLNILPEKILLDSIRHTSIKLSENMEKFRNKSSKLLNGGVISSQIESATSYIQHLVSTFSEANDIYQIKDGVLDEAQHRLTEIAQLVSSSFLRHSSVSVDSTSTNDGPILNSSGENSPVDNSPLSSDSGEE